MRLKTMHDAVQIIGRTVGIADLAPNAAGAFELVFLRQLPVYFQVVGDAEIEVAIRLGEGGHGLSDEVLTAMLAANLDLRHGRLALEPGGDRVVYGGRLTITMHDADSLIRTVSAMIREGAAWRLEHFDALTRSVAAQQSTSGVMSDNFIRI